MNKKRITGTIILILGCIVIITGVITFINNKKLEDQITTSWGKEYYKYLKYNLINKNPIIKSYNINFYEVETVKDPVMVVEYLYRDKTYSNIYYLKKDKLKYVNLETPTTVELLYNIPDNKYEYYLHGSIVGNTNSYESVKNQIKDSVEIQKKSQEYYFVANDKKSPKFESIFKKIDIKKEDIVLNNNSSSKDIQIAINKKIKEYKPIKEIIKNK